MNYFEDGVIIAESGDVRIYAVGDIQYLDIGPGHNLWADSDEIKEYHEQIKDYPRGNCLEIGLGLGVASEYILRRADFLTTVEINPDIIEAWQQINNPNPKHKIICDEGLHFIRSTEDTYDFIFFDFYTELDEDSLPIIEEYYVEVEKILRPGGDILAWFDIYTPEEIVENIPDSVRRILNGDKNR